MAAPIHDLLPSILDAGAPLNIIECGCHEGWDTRELRKRFPTACIVAIEPDPRNLARLYGRGVDRLARIIPAAVSASVGRATFHQSAADMSIEHPQWLNSADYAGSSSLKAPAQATQLHKWLTFDNAVEVETTTLDAVAEQQAFTTIDLIWADVQGAEDLIIAGGQRALARTRYFYTEFSEVEEYRDQIPMREIIARLPGEWSIVKQFDYDVLLKNETLAAIQTGHAATPAVTQARA